MKAGRNNRQPLCQSYLVKSFYLLPCAVLSHSVMSDSWGPTGSSVHADSPGKNNGVGCHALIQGISQPMDSSRSPALQVDSLPPGKPKNTGVGSLALHQRIFLTQELSQGLLHCRRILSHLSYEGSPKVQDACEVKIAQLCLTLCNCMDYTVHGILGQNTGVSSLSLLQEIVPTQESNPGLPHCRWILYQLNHKGSPRILEWVTYPFLQGIFPTQESNWGLPYCRQILYQLSYQGSKGFFLTFG